jgi:hypothetical protein
MGAMLKTISLIAAAGIAAVLAYAATRPDTFRVARTATVQAPPEKLHALINDLHASNTWNPFEKGDPRNRGEYSEGPSPFLARLIGVFMNMDSMVGGQFESGLADLKQRAERT